jgi:hypothetical protein
MQMRMHKSLMTPACSMTNNMFCPIVAEEDGQ